jgi:murein DD-endopeptidase MepM/ murein hydrolase activator NlpD
MVRDDRLYAFIVARTTRSRSRIRRISIHKRSIKLLVCLCLALFGVALYGLYGLTQQAIHLRIEHENARLRAENEKQLQLLKNLNQRVQAVEDTSRRLAEMSGVSAEQQTNERGAGGPALPLDSAETISAVEYKTSYLEKALGLFEATINERGTLPSIWPVAGELTDGFGGRRNPFGGFSSEFHAGQDIATLWGTPVVAAGNGTVIFAGWQSGYGQLVVIDHGNGLTSRYGHLSKVEVTVGQKLVRGEMLGRVGSTGRSTGPHLHFEVRVNDEPVDPLPYLPRIAG